MKTFRYSLPFLLLLLIFCGCSHHPADQNPQNNLIYQPPSQSELEVFQFAPHFVVYDSLSNHNLIGRVSARFDTKQEEQIFIDTNHPTLYFGTDSFTTQKDSYTNYIYRIHFPETPFSLFPFYLTSGSNPGLIIIVTVGSNHKPLLVTAVHTCGCYLAIIPTSFLSKNSYPKCWDDEVLEVYGEQLTPLLDFNSYSNPILFVLIRPDIHRVMNLELAEKSSLKLSPSSVKMMAAAELANLEAIPLAETTTSFFHHGGILDGHVKGSTKPWETLLMSLISLDLFVGSDKKYDLDFQTTNPFYTSLKPWNRTASDMRDFKRFLQFWGWRL